MTEVRTEVKATPFGDWLVARTVVLGELDGIGDGSSNLTRLFELFIASVALSEVILSFSLSLSLELSNDK